MGILSDIVGAFTGKPQREAAKQQAESIERGQDITREAAEKARTDILRLFPQAQQDITQGFQGALDVFSQAIPQQTQAFQGGNVAAQNTLLAGLPQFQNALFGGQVDLSGFTPFQQSVDLSFANQQLPNQAALTTQDPRLPSNTVSEVGGPMPDIIGLLGGNLGGSTDNSRWTQPVNNILAGNAGSQNLTNAVNNVIGPDIGTLPSRFNRWGR